MRLRDEAAEVRVATRCLDEERYVRTVEERERERGIAKLGGLQRKLLGKRCAVEEGVGAVAVELDVLRRAHVRLCSPTAYHPSGFRRYARRREVGWAHPIPKPYACCANHPSPSSS